MEEDYFSRLLVCNLLLPGINLQAALVNLGYFVLNILLHVAHVNLGNVVYPFWFTQVEVLALICA